MKPDRWRQLNLQSDHQLEGMGKYLLLFSPTTLIVYGPNILTPSLNLTPPNLDAAHINKYNHTNMA